MTTTTTALPDDVVETCGRRVGLRDVERVLSEHAAVTEAAAIGVPDPRHGAIVHAFVTLVPERTSDVDLLRELIDHARRRLGPLVAPREIEVRDRLPAEHGPRVMRRLLHDQHVNACIDDVTVFERPS